MATAAAPAGAALITYEGFDYPNGQALHEEPDGGIGWDGPWLRATGTRSPEVSRNAALDYRDSQGHELVAHGHGAYVPRTFRNAIRSLAERRTAAVTWISFLIRPTYELIPDEANVLRLQLRDGDSTRLSLGKIDGTPEYGMAAQGTPVYSEISGEEEVDDAFPTRLIVVRYAIGTGEEDGEVRLFMNPDLELEPDLEEADAVLSGLDSTEMPFDAVYFDGTGGGTQERTRGHIDEIRLGGSFDAVTPFEVPATPTPTPEPVERYGYPVAADLIHTGALLGTLHVEFAPWTYSYQVGNWIYLPDPESEMRYGHGVWFYALNAGDAESVNGQGAQAYGYPVADDIISTGTFLRDLNVAQAEFGWAYSYRLESWIYLGDPDANLAASYGAWAYLPIPPTATTSEITRFGITWTFDGEYEYGRYANGDYWVVGPVTIEAIDPPSTEINGRTRHGSMINPSPADGTTQGYDSAMSVTSYEPAFNAALDVSAESPLVVPPGSSLVSTISVDEAGHRPQIRESSILTVVDHIPPEGSFRPPYSGSDKSSRFNVAQLDTAVLERLDRVAGTPDVESVADRFERPWVEHIPGWNGREAYPQRNMPGYGRDIAARVGEAALMLHLDFPLEEKEPLLIRFVQLGIDNFGVVEDGGRTNWVPNGGHGSGRKWPVLFAGIVLGDPEMKAIGERSGSYLYSDDFGPGDPPPDYVHFGEDSQTFYVEETAPGEYNYGHGGYTAEHEGMPEYGIRHATDPSRNDVSWGGASYRICCTGNAWVGFVLAARIMEARELWNHDPLFDYQDRFMQVQEEEGAPSWQRSWNEFVETMWDTYRDAF